MTDLPPIAVIVASLGRPENLTKLLERLSDQSCLPAEVILSMESDADAPAARDWPFPVKRVFGPRGMTVQRNRGFDLLDPTSAVAIFYDDDFVPSRYAIEGIQAFFAAHPEVAGAEGMVLADGITHAGIAPDKAQELMDAADQSGPWGTVNILATRQGLYGCNMAYRLSAIKGLRFDEDLPLYAWLEDLDFGARIKGPLVRTDAFRGVHCGEKRGREKSGRRLGYSQVANPVYMVRKGTLSHATARRHILRNLAANHAKILRPEPWVDRKGRAAGNWLALLDILRGRCRPDRILEL